ncbi:hypothetical protein KAR91_72800 [Candidatus Pacearchaeota archaeon]|nr:hypothetical protein [Candidatus Pacearchaeota archaeon]
MKFKAKHKITGQWLYGCAPQLHDDCMTRMPVSRFFDMVENGVLDESTLERLS